MNLLTIYREGSNTVMRDDATKETAILETQEQAVSNFASWILTGKLSGIPTVTATKNAKDTDFSKFVKEWVQIETKENRDTCTCYKRF